MKSAVMPKLDIQRLYIKECSYKTSHAPDIFADASVQADFPALLLAPMNFEHFYQQQQQSSEVPAKENPLN